MNDWARMEELTRMMAVALLQRVPPQGIVSHTPDDEKAADDWLRRWNAHDPALQLPTGPVLPALLLARFRYATAFATQCRLAGYPPLPGSADQAVEALVIDLWYLQFRERWLGGERGVLPSDN
jgi:hypothetical protein